MSAHQQQQGGVAPQRRSCRAARCAAAVERRLAPGFQHAGIGPGQEWRRTAPPYRQALLALGLALGIALPAGAAEERSTAAQAAVAPAAAAPAAQPAVAGRKPWVELPPGHAVDCARPDGKVIKLICGTGTRAKLRDLCVGNHFGMSGAELRLCMALGLRKQELNPVAHSLPVRSREEQQARARTAQAMFAERCQKAGEFIHRTVEGVEGIYLLKLRPRGSSTNHGENTEQQYRLDDPYGRDVDGEGYILSFTRGHHQATHIGTPAPGSPPRLGYHYVEADDPGDGRRYRYTGHIDQPWLRDKSYGEWVREFVLDEAPAPGAPPRYGVTFEDLSTRQERDYWIAGSSLKVLDLKTGEVLAERIGYMWDPAQGSRAGARSPWLEAANHACPGFQRNPLRPLTPGWASAAQLIQTLDFVEKVLIPKP
jgi:hypothetical protein